MAEENKKTEEEVKTSEAEIQEQQEETPETPQVETVEEPTPEAVSEEPKAEAAAEEVTNEAEEQSKEAAPKKARAKKAQPELVPTTAEPEADFNWDEFEHGIESYKADEVEKMDALYEGTLTSIDEGQVIHGTVVSVNKKEVVINIGYKSEGIVAASEFRYNPDLKPGDKVEVFVESQEDKNGQLIISHKTARIHNAWERVNNALANDEIINGYVKCRTKGGLIVDVFGLEAFLPGSQIDVKPIRDYDMYVGKTMEFKVVKINHEYKNVVVSHKALIEAELEIQKAEIISKLEKGQILEGTVKNITSYGVFVDLGGVDGLIHITDLSWGRINHPEEIVELDQKINVVILDFDDNKKRIALGLKQLTSHPWDSLDPELKIGDKVKGKVVVIADYGAFIEIAPGVEGLIHVSEMSWSQHLRTAQDFLKVGDEVEGVILTLDREERKMSLGIKQLIPDPWENIHEKYPNSSKHTATVRNFTNFGIFVELEEGVDGLIHISDLSWSKKIKHPAEFTKIGESIEVVVLDVDKENRRLSLGHKQLEENPWDVFESVFTLDSVHQGTIVGSSDKGVIVALPYGVEGFAPTRHILKEDGTAAKMDETLDFKVIEFNKDSKKIVVSHSKVYQDAQNQEKASAVAEKRAQEKTTKKSVKKIKDTMEKTTLGDLGVLANLRSDLEKSEKTPKKAAPKAEEKKEEAPKAEKAEEKKEEAPKAEKAEEKKEEAPKAEKAQEKKEEAPKAEKAEEKKEEPKAEETPKAEKAEKKESAAKKETAKEEKEEAPKAKAKKEAAKDEATDKKSDDADKKDKKEE